MNSWTLHLRTNSFDFSILFSQGSSSSESFVFLFKNVRTFELLKILTPVLLVFNRVIIMFCYASDNLKHVVWPLLHISCL